MTDSLSVGRWDERGARVEQIIAPEHVDQMRASGIVEVAEYVRPGFPRVQGRCPSCGGNTLILGSGGYATCTLLRCADPLAPSKALGVEFDD
jgi:hypothetical protein